MYINTVSSYLQEQIITNEYIKNLNGLSEEWILRRNGINERRKANAEENEN